MFSQYHSNIKTAITFLKLLHVRINNVTVSETLQNHKDWPSMLCVSDALQQWNVANGVATINTAEIDQLPLPFIAYIKNGETPLHIVTAVTDKTVTYLNNNYQKSIIVAKEGFISNWGGVYLIAEPNEHSGEKNYENNKRKAILRSVIPATALLLVALVSFFLFQKNGVYPSVGLYIEYGILLLGVIVTTLLLWYEIDKSNPLLQKVCTGIAKGNCNAILTGKKAKVFSWLSWSEVGFFYFVDSMLALIFIPNAISIIAWLHILALPYTVFSVYYQWQVAKQWCVLCLAVQALLVLGAANVMANNVLVTDSVFNLSTLLWLLAMYALPMLVWYAIKPYILQLQQAKTTKREYLRIKFNSEIFETLLNKQKKITIPTDGLGITIGNPNAANTLIKVCNPYCGPCAKAHPKIEKLLEATPNLKVQIIFFTPNQPEHPAFKPVSHLMAIQEQNTTETVAKALNDWYLSEEKDYNVFDAKYPLNGDLNRQGGRIEEMDKWCNKMELTYTPTIFINNKQLPNAYSIEDLQYFLLE